MPVKELVMKAYMSVEVRPQEFLNYGLYGSGRLTPKEGASPLVD
jgi:hypothetical protein